jgi:hypothetical protein
MTSGTTDPIVTDPAAVPAPIRRYLAAHDRHATDDALVEFTPDATVVDEDHRFVGVDAIRSWLDTAAREFTYTRTFLDAQAVDATTWVVRNRLEGDFPGGLVDLRHRFVLAGDRIAELVIAP